MPRVLSFVSALLLTLFLAGISPGQQMNNCCLKDTQMTNCTCAEHSATVHGAAVHGTSGGHDCCMSDECGELLLARDIAISPTFSPLEFSGTIEKVSFPPSSQRKITESHRTGLFLPHLPATPIYNLHCSFLI